MINHELDLTNLASILNGCKNIYYNTPPEIRDGYVWYMSSETRRALEWYREIGSFTKGILNKIMLKPIFIDNEIPFSEVRFTDKYVVNRVANRAINK